MRRRCACPVPMPPQLVNLTNWGAASSISMQVGAACAIPAPLLIIKGSGLCTVQTRHGLQVHRAERCLPHPTEGATYLNRPPTVPILTAFGLPTSSDSGVIMAEKFDASLSERYYEWLSIAPEDQPPTLYRLLGLRTFEDKPNVIENAADRQMAHLRTFQSGKHSKESQKILNHVASARVTLLNPEKKEKYDKLLREQMRLEAESVLDDESASRHEELSTTLVGFLDAIEASKLKEAAEEIQKKPKPAEPRKPSSVASDQGGPDRKLMIGGAVGVGVLLLLVVGVLVWKLGGGKEEGQKPQEMADWLDAGGEKGRPSSPVKATEPSSTGEQARAASQSSQDRSAVPLLIEPPKSPTDSGEPAASPPLTSTPLVLLNFEETSGKLLDSSGNNHHGKVVGNVKYAQPGKQGLALGFDGSGGHVVIEGSEKFDFNKDFTWAAWVKTKEDGGIMAFAKEPSPWVPGVKAMYIYHGSFGFHIRDAGRIHHQGDIRNDKWRHLAVVVTPNTAGKGNVATLHIDGKVWGKNDWDADKTAPAKSVLKIGHCTTDFEQTFTGLIDTVTIWDRALTPEEIAALAAGKTLEPPQVVATEEPKKPTEPAPKPEPSPNRLSIPPAANRQKMLGQLNDVYDFDKRRTAAERVQLATELLNLGKKSQGGPAEKFMLFFKAMEVAQSGGDADLMLEAVEAMSAEFKVDVLEGKQSALAGFVKGNPDEEKNGQVPRSRRSCD